MIPIPEDFWERRMNDWRTEELQIKAAIEGVDNGEAEERALNAERVFKLANQAYSLYVSHDRTEKARLLRMLFSSCSVDAIQATPTFRKPFDLIFKRAGLEEWSQHLWSKSDAPTLQETRQAENSNL